MTAPMSRPEAIATLTAPGGPRDVEIANAQALSDSQVIFAGTHNGPLSTIAQDQFDATSLVSRQPSIEIIVCWAKQSTCALLEWPNVEPPGDDRQSRYLTLAYSCLR
jgi:hypothetical protein